MKALVNLFAAALLALALAGCGSSNGGDANAPKQDTTQPEQTQPADTQETTDAQPTDEELAAREVANLAGTWGHRSLTDERLVFNPDGTGTYQGIFDKDFTFTYTVTVEHRTYNNGEVYDSNILTITFDNGVTEQILYFYQDDAHTKIGLHNYEDGGYYGTLNDSEYQKQ